MHFSRILNPIQSYSECHSVVYLNILFLRIDNQQITKSPQSYKNFNKLQLPNNQLLQCMNKKTIILFFLFLFSFLSPTYAQTLSGKITDAETNQPLEAVMISVLRGHTTIDYALTDAKGQFSLPWKHSGMLQLNISLLGYKREMRNINAAGILNLSLQPEAIVLKEVQIRPGRINTRKDTVRYDLAQFASSKDVHIKDVLKKLPGVDVDENGQVKYKGKAIDHYFVEGMDVTGGRYNQINNNLSAKAVKSAEIMENYQSVKALKGKINSDEVALNLKLDPKARDQWIANGTLGTGWSENNKILWEGRLNALQLGKGKQSVYNYKTNNNGKDLSNEQTKLTGNGQQQVPLSGFLSQPGISAPLDKNRLLFNETHTLNGNRMYKWNDDRSLRLQAGYTHELIRQQRGNTQIYYQPTDTIQIDETYHYRLRSDIANLELRYEDNSSRNYISNRFTVDGEINRGRSEELGQTLQTSQLSAGNYFNLIRNRESGTWEFRSVTQYTYQPASLLLEEGKSKFNQHNFYTDNSAAYLRKHNGFTQQYKAGIQGERATLKYTPTRQPNDFNASHLSLYLTPYFQLERGKWLTTLSLPLKAERYFSQQRSFLFFNPSTYLRYKLDYHWTFSLYGSLKRSAGDFSDLYPGLYQTDYRTWRDGNGLFPTNTTQTYNLYGEYKNTVQEFFITAALTYSRSNRNTLFEQSVSEDAIVYTRRELPNHSDSWNLSSTLSKGIYDWHLKTSLTLLLSRSNGEQLTRLADSKGNQQSLLQTYRYDYLKAEPKIIWSPADVFEAEYHATLGYGGSKIGSDTRLTPLLDFVQRLHLTFSIGQVDLRLSGEHYRNDLGGNTHLNTVFADASLIYKRKKWRLEATLNNLFNKKEYAYTTYSATQSYTSRLNIRPREAMVTVNYQF